MIKVSKKILKQIGRTNAQLKLIQDNDKVLVGLSGGKDSLTMVHSLKYMQQNAPFKFEFKALTIDYGMGENFDKLIQHCNINNIPHHIHKTNIYNLAKDKIRENSSFCSFFSRMRRGALYTYALDNGFNKIALGHHLDDAVESFFMNLFYNGQMRSMPPIYKAKNGLLIIRPMIMLREKQLIDFANKNNLPIIGDEACPAMQFNVKMPYARAKIKNFLKDIEKEYDNIFNIIKSGFHNISDDTFFDKNRFKI